MERDVWKDRTVLVAGGTGFFGGWLVRRLLENEARVVAIVRSLDRASQFEMEDFSNRTTVETGDLRDRDFLRGLFERHKFDFFFHGAYGSDVNAVLEEPMECFQSSVESTWTTLDMIRCLQPDCISVISSSDKAYGAQDLPYRETSPLTPIHPYEVAKASQDLAAQSFGKSYGLPVAVTRCANYFGPYDFNYTRLIPGSCRSLAAGEPPVLRCDGLFTRDFLYIEDAVDAHLLLAERLKTDPSLRGEAFNFSYENQIEVFDIVLKLTELAGVNVEPVVQNRVQAEIRHMHLASDKARTRLGWYPTTGFDKGLHHTVKWYLSHLQTTNLK